MRKLFTMVAIGLAIGLTVVTSEEASSTSASKLEQFTQESQLEQSVSVDQERYLRINPIVLSGVGKLLGDSSRCFKIGVGADFKQVDIEVFKNEGCTITFQEWIDDKAGKLSVEYCFESENGVPVDKAKEVLKQYCSVTDWYSQSNCEVSDAHGNRCCVRTNEDDTMVTVSVFCSAVSLGEDKTTSKYHLAS